MQSFKCIDQINLKMKYFIIQKKKNILPQNLNINIKDVKKPYLNDKKHCNSPIKSSPKPV